MQVMRMVVVVCVCFWMDAGCVVEDVEDVGEEMLLQ